MDRHHRRTGHGRPIPAVERAEAYVRAHSDRPVAVARLCLVAGLSERGLRGAFRRVRGISPKRYILRERLRAVRQALLDAAGPSVTVTHIATCFGFYELGRFAGYYRELYGEAPSETLRRTVPRRSSSAGDPHGYPDCARPLHELDDGATLR